MINDYLDADQIKHSIKEYFKDKSNLYSTIFIVVFLAGWGGYRLYYWHNTNVQENAYLSFSDSLEVYNKALMQSFEAEKTKLLSDWDDAELAFRIGYEQNSSAGIAPFFLAYQANSLAMQGDIDKALQVLDKAISKFKSGSDFYYLFKTTRALVLFEQNQEQAVNELTQLSTDSKNALDVMALYYLGEYYYSIGDLNSAKKNFEDVLVKNTKNKLGLESSWVDLAKQRLEQL